MASSRTQLVTVAATQLSCSADSKSNVDAAEKLVRRAAEAGANVILLQELFATQYFCQEQSEKYYAWAESEESSKLLERFQRLAGELGVVSFAESPQEWLCYYVLCCPSYTLRHYLRSCECGPKYESLQDLV